MLVTPSGKYWRCDYRYKGLRKTAAFGVFPEVPLTEARSKRDVLRGLLRQGIDPSSEFGKNRSTREPTFGDVARAWSDLRKGRYTSKSERTVQYRLDKYIIPALGKMQLNDIEPRDILSMVRKAEAQGHIETAHRLRSISSQIFQHAMAEGLVKHDPAASVMRAMKPLNVQHMPSITEPTKIGALLRAIDGYDGTAIVKFALQLAPHVFLRPGELRFAEWNELDLENHMWTIPAHRTKLRRDHLVPLSTQSLEILNNLRPITGDGILLFPGTRSASRPISDNTLNAALRRLGYSKDEIVAHGFRSMASTRLHELKWNTDVIERQLAHVEGNSVKKAYNRAEHIDQRIEMMQFWSNYLDCLKASS